MDSSYTLVVQANIPTVLENGKISYNLESYQFDKVEDNTISLDSDITTHPMVNGDIVADHMFNNPFKINIRGSFSLIGNKRTYYGGLDRLAIIQETFERIKREGITCNIIKSRSDTGETIRFKVRNNCALNSIVWTEGQSRLDFEFGFTEVQFVDVSLVEYDVDVMDPNLPSVTNANTLNFMDTFLDMNLVTNYVIKVLNKENLLPDEVITYFLKTVSSGLIVSSIVAVAVGLVALKTAIMIAGGVAAAFPVGTIVAGALALGAFIIGGIFTIIKASKKSNAQKKYKIKAFELYKNDKKNQAEVTRFCNYLGSIHQNLEYLNDVMSVFGIATNEAQECLTYINNIYYSFVFTKSNVGNEDDVIWSLKVTEIGASKENEEKFNQINIKSFSKSSIAECNTNNALFRTPGGGYYVYLINLNLAGAIERGALPEEIKEIENDLTNYAIFVSQTNLDNFNEMLEEIVKNAMTM